MDLAFCEGDLAQWAAEGTVAVLPSLGDLQPVTGGHLLYMTSGNSIPGVVQGDFALNLATFGMSAAQFLTCLPEGTHNVTIVWRVYSEEFKEWCGSGYQDQVLVKLVFSDGGETVLLQRYIDDLCPSGECADCGKYYEGLEQSSFALDQGDVWNTPWVTSVVPIVIKEQSPLTIHLEVSDHLPPGGSYDTVLVVDRITLGDYVSCTADCTDKQCGSDDCGGSCGVCPAHETCNGDGQCDCTFEECGGQCCPGPSYCCVEDECCLPSCLGKVCGSDGCDGTCGQCPEEQACNEEGQCE